MIGKYLKSFAPYTDGVVAWRRCTIGGLRRGAAGTERAEIRGKAKRFRNDNEVCVNVRSGRVLQIAADA
jgi:hypothetical protein